MNIKKESINYNPNRMIYWTRIHFVSDDNSKKTKVLTAASYEYLSDTNRLPGNKEITDEHLDLWVEGVIEKWSEFGDDIFKNKVHYDGYVSNQKDEPNIIDFLVNTVKA